MPNTDYRPKHKRVLHDSTPRGLPRWLRAADNAVRNPNSPGAKLYYRRVANAQRLREQYGDGGPVVFYDYRYSNWETREITVSDKRNAIACSFFCAAMHVQQAYLQEFEHVQEGVIQTLHWMTREPIEYPNYVRYETPVEMQKIVEFLECDPRTNLLSLTDIKLKRSVKCIVCWTPVKPR